MFSWNQLIVALLIIVVVYFVTSRLSSWVSVEGNGLLPPIYSGWIPWLGCAFEFGKSPLSFIEAKRKQLGPVFTLKVAGERMTFLTEPDDFHLFFRSANVDFQKAVQNAVQNVASVTEGAFFENHTKIHDTVKGKLSAGNLSAICQTLHAEFQQHLSQFLVKCENGESNQTDLNQLVRSTMYKSVINNLFGKGMLPTDQEESFKELEKNFVVFDDQFEYGARLPQVFLNKSAELSYVKLRLFDLLPSINSIEWSSAKRWLLSLFSKVVTQSMENMPTESANQTLVQTLLSMVDEEFAPNWGVLLLWASLANAIPITFWTLVLIYSHPRVLAKVQAEVDAVLVKEDKSFSESTLSQMPYTKQCILEAIRLRSPGIITRRVVVALQAQGYTIPPGDLLMVSPFWAHRNPESFPDPDKFQPERWEKMEKNAFPEEFIAFGGGRYQCPGRWFALMEIHMYVSMFINMFDCKLLSGVPGLCELHLVGTQQPVQDCPVLIKQHKLQ